MQLGTYSSGSVGNTKCLEFDTPYIDDHKTVNHVSAEDARKACLHQKR